MRATGSPESKTRSAAASDPGRAFLYSGSPATAPSPPARLLQAEGIQTPPRAPSSSRPREQPWAGERRVSTAGSLPMAPSDAAGGSSPWGSSPATASPAVADGAAVDRWAQAVDNLEDARQAAESLVRTVDEAIYMVSILHVYHE